VAVAERDFAELLASLRELQTTLQQAEQFRNAAEPLELASKTLQDLAPMHALLGRLQDQLRLPEHQMREVVERLLHLAAAQAEHAAHIRSQLMEVLMADLDVLDPVPRASVSQARRVAETRNRLLAGGAWTVSALAEARSSSKSAVRTWLTRQRGADRIVSVSVRGETYVPDLLLDEAAEPYRQSDHVLRPLLQTGLDAWAVWAWLDSPSPWLDGERPADLLATGDFERAAMAAEAQAANAAPSTLQSKVA
jgi:hypothetical protein